MNEEQNKLEDAQQKKLPDDPTLSELFTYFMDENAVRVVPLTVKEDPTDTRLALLIAGDMETASVIFAELWSRIEELSAIEKQQEANAGPRLITP